MFHLIFNFVNLGYDIHIVYYYIVSEAKSIANYSLYIYQVKSCFELLQYGCKMFF